MQNNYEVPEALELGQTRNLILGEKVICPDCFESVLGPGWRFLITDIDESDE